MRIFRPAVFFLVGIGALLGVTGCGEEVRDAREASKPGGTQPAATTDTLKATPGGKESDAAGAAEKSPVKSAGLPKLPGGAGPVDPDAPEEFTQTDSGLRYRILRKSDGEKPKVNDPVVADYKGWFDDGRQFDSSYDAGKPLDFIVKTGRGGVIPGWVEGLQLIGVGGMIELEIPGDLAYGPQGHPAGIPPNATLHFVIELKEIK